MEVAGHRIVEIGGSDVVSYADLMQEYARQRGLKRLIIPVPWLTPRLSSLWLGLVTPLFASIGKTLIDSLRHPTVVQDTSALDTFSIEPKGVADSIADALSEEETAFAQTHWSDSLVIGNTYKKWGGVRFGTRLVDSRKAFTEASEENAFSAIQRIGGKTGWYFATWLWKLRGLIDLAFGGVGMRRGRRHPVNIRPGDVIDCWRVERFEPNRLLRLQAEMKLPGRAWLIFEVKKEGERTQIVQTAIFDPIGLSGLLYWYGIYPLHQIIFAGMLKALVKAAEK
jgi:hypothetical protein